MKSLPNLDKETPHKTLQIATISDDVEVVSIGLRNFPAHKLALICDEGHKRPVEEFASKVRYVLKIPVDIYPIGGNLLSKILETFAEIAKKDGQSYDDIVVNVSGGEKLLGCAALSAAFINGLKAFAVAGGAPLMLPVLKLSYTELISKAKLDILRAMSRAGGEVVSLRQLSELSGYGKPLLSYHIRGTKEARGLTELGLVEVKRESRGRSKVLITTFGKMLLQGLQA